MIQSSTTNLPSPRGQQGRRRFAASVRWNFEGKSVVLVGGGGSRRAQSTDGVANEGADDRRRNDGGPSVWTLCRQIVVDPAQVDEVSPGRDR